MGDKLWHSKVTGVTRKGASFTELQDVFINNVTTKYIFEPLLCCRLTDNVNEVKQILLERDFDTLGVTDEKNKKLGFVVKDQLKGSSIEESLREFSLNQIISDSTPISDLLEVLSDKTYVYVLSKDSIEGIVTRADINKPIVRIYLFGIISLYELHLNYWINHYYHKESWMKILKENRIESAIKIYDERKGNNTQLSLLECLQFCDKRDILISINDFRESFSYTKNSFKQLLTKIEKIRNELAHSQTSIIANLGWEDFTDSIKKLKEFLVTSEAKIKE